MEKVAKVLEYMGDTYQYSHAKKNILTYISQPCHYYEDCEEDGGILVVEYRPNCKNHQYLVLHSLRIGVHNGRIEHRNISKQSKIAKPYND